MFKSGAKKTVGSSRYVSGAWGLRQNYVSNFLGNSYTLVLEHWKNAFSFFGTIQWNGYRQYTF